jgi:hypothetical protein
MGQQDGASINDSVGGGPPQGLRVEVGLLGSSLQEGVQATPRPLHDYYAALR